MSVPEEYLNGQPISFERWCETLRPHQMNSEDRARYQTEAQRLMKNRTLNRLLNSIEAECLWQIKDAPIHGAEQAEEARLMLRAVTSLRARMNALAEDLSFEQKRSSKNQ